MELLTNSARSKFGSCHRAYQYAYVMLRRPNVDAEALRFGTLVHKALEAWWMADVPDRLNSALFVIAMEMENGVDAYLIATCRALIYGYDAEYRNQPLETILVEAQYEAPLMNPSTGGVSRTWSLGGKIDAIAKEASGRMVIIEHKTTVSDLSLDSDYWKKLVMDGQVSGYYLGARALGFDVQDCIYDVIRKPTIRPGSIPLVDEDGIKIVHDSEGCRVRTKDGKKWRQTGSTEESYFLQSRPETADEWEFRLTEDIQANPSKYYARKNVARLESDMLDYLVDMWSVGREIADAGSFGRYARNPNSCSGFGTCEYFAVCCGEASIEDDHLFKTEETAHRELSAQPAIGGN